MPIPYTKPHLSYGAQVALLRARGLRIDDEQHAMWHLEKLGYYRLSGYLYPFRVLLNVSDAKLPVRDSRFIEGSTFEQVAALYKFDQSLRQLLLVAIEKIEVSMRAKLAYHMGAMHPCAHLDKSLVNPKFCEAPSLESGEIARKSNFEIWVDSHDKLVTRSKEDFVQHFRRTYEPPIPLWVSIEVWDFGLLSHYFGGLRDRDKLTIAGQMGIQRHALLTSWLRTVSHARNICAHHSRLWNRSIVDSPKPPGRNELPMLDHLMGDKNQLRRQRVYGALAVTQFLLHASQFDTQWKESLKTLIDAFPACPHVATIDAMGFPTDWKTLELWK